MAFTRASNEPNTDGDGSGFRLIQYAIGVLAAACVVNVSILLVSVAAIELPPEFVGGPFGPLAVGPVVVNTTIATVGATVVYGVIARYAARPDRTFVLVSLVAFVLSFAMFLAPDIAGAPPAVYAVLSVMHVATAIVVVGGLTR